MTLHGLDTYLISLLPKTSQLRIILAQGTGYYGLAYYVWLPYL